MEEIRQGEYRIIRTDGTEILIEEKPNMDSILKAIGDECADTVCLDKQTRTQIMVVDDTGMVDGKPVNSKATELYHSVCKREPCTRFTATWPFCNDLDLSSPHAGHVTQPATEMWR